MKLWLGQALKRAGEKSGGEKSDARGLMALACMVVVGVAFVAHEPAPARADSFFNKVFGNFIPGNSGHYRRSRKSRSLRGNGSFGIGKMRPTRLNRKAKRKPRISRRSLSKKTAGLKRSARRGVRQSVRQGGAYRTMCVRQCDGYYFPVSFSTSKGNLKTDAQACRSRCGAPARLYYYPNPGGSLKKMVAYRGGKPYEKLKNAFRFKKEFVANCRCRPEPWTREAKLRHKRYALAGLDPYRKMAASKRKKSRRYSSRSRHKKARRGRWASKDSSKAKVRRYVRNSSTGGRYYRRLAAKRRYYLRTPRRSR